MTIKLSTLGNGLKVVTENVDTAHAASFGLHLGVGSRIESGESLGYAHLLEHMLFRGSSRFESLQIDRLFDAMGGDFNASTSKEDTSIYGRVQGQDLEQALEIACDMAFSPQLDQADLALEQQIVCEEMAMIDDSPEELVFELAPATVFGDGGLGRPIIGNQETVQSATVGSLRAFHGAHYLANNCVLSVAGAVDHDRLLDKLNELFGDGWEATANSKLNASPSVHASKGSSSSSPKISTVDRQIEQMQLIIAAPGLQMSDPRRFALRVLDCLLGGSSSSLLFQEIREKRGLAYSVSTFDDSLTDNGLVGLYLATRPENLQQCVEVVNSEIEALMQGNVKTEDFELCKKHVTARLVLGQDSLVAKMQKLGKCYLHNLELLSVPELMKRISDVKVDDLVELTQMLYAPDQRSVTMVGPIDQNSLAAARVAAPSANNLQASTA